MAITEIHSIASTPHLALNYCLADKTEKISSAEDVRADIPHELFEVDGEQYVRYFTLTSYQNCNVNNPFSSFDALRKKWQNVKYQNNGVRSKSGKEPLMYHLYQSFSGREVSFETANEIGLKLAEEVFKGFTVCVSTHGNTDNIHNHFNISAWDENGKKWNDCHKTKRLIRQVSDRLCEEYGLSVLEHTRDMKLVKYRDSDGKLHYYEPTDRKNELIQKRNSGEITTDDVRSYRNTKKYEDWKEARTDNRNEIKKDIDTLLPSCRSYDELIFRLRELGYIVKDKKKNGEWLAHISFQAPTHAKATREDKLGDGQFYLRENLEKHIDERVKESQIPHREEFAEASEYNFENYEYGKTNIDELDYDYKTVVVDGKKCTVPRSATEKKVISDIRIKDKDIKGLIDTSQLDKIINEINNGAQIQKRSRAEAKARVLVVQIQESFRCLRYVEHQNIYSYEQIIDLYAACKIKYEATADNFLKVENAIEHLKEVLTLPEKLETLQARANAQKGELSYLLERYNDDKKKISQYKFLIEKYKIDTPEGYSDLKQKIAEFEAKQILNREYMSDVIARMSELENCIKTFNRIDTERGVPNEEAMRSFKAIQTEQKQQTTKKLKE